MLSLKKVIKRGPLPEISFRNRRKINVSARVCVICHFFKKKNRQNSRAISRRFFSTCRRIGDFSEKPESPKTVKMIKTVICDIKRSVVILRPDIIIVAPFIAIRIFVYIKFRSGTV